MGRFTFEDTKAENQKLETYEWDNIWWNNAPDKEKRRVLIIGDSITCGYRDDVNELLGGEIYIDGYASSKAVDNPFLIPAIDLMIAQSNCFMILFNSGLHGFHLDEETYRINYIKIVNHLMEKYPEKKLTLMTSTPVRDEENRKLLSERTEREVVVRNKVVKEIAADKGLDIIDLFGVLINEDYRLWRDIVHLYPEGNDKLAAVVTEYIKKNM